MRYFINTVPKYKTTTYSEASRRYTYKELKRREDILNGIHSGLPICCVKFYSKLSYMLPVGTPTARYAYENIHGIPWASTPLDYVRVPFGGAQYLRCPDCMRTGKVVRLKRNGVYSLVQSGDLIKTVLTRDY